MWVVILQFIALFLFVGCCIAIVFWKSKYDAFALRKHVKPHKHDWERQNSIGAYYDANKYDIMKCKTCGSEGKRWRGQTQATKRTELCLSLPHEHDWCFEYFGGRKHDEDKNTPLSEVVSCECGQWAVKHYGETEYNLLGK